MSLLLSTPLRHPHFLLWHADLVDTAARRATTLWAEPWKLEEYGHNWQFLIGPSYLSADWRDGIPLFLSNGSTEWVEWPVGSPSVAP